MKIQPLLRIAAAALALTLQAHAQWVTQTVTLKTGWNAVFLHVDASHATLDQLVGGSAPELTPIQQVWRWNPNPATAQFIAAPQEPGAQPSQWSSWVSADDAGSALHRLAANTAYLVLSGADYTWRIVGRPVLPDYRWSTSGMNLLGFPAVPSSPPTIESYLGPAPALQGGELYRYPGGDLGPENPSRIFALRTERIQRGQAYWVRAGDNYNQYYGPFGVTASGIGRIEFGGDQNTYSFRIRNLTDRPLTVSLRLKASETPPAPLPPYSGTPPLLVRGAQDPTLLTYGLTELTTNSVVTRALTASGLPGSETEVVIGLDHGKFTGMPGDQFAGVLQLTDSLGHSLVELGATATVGSAAGLWVGTAAVSEVAQYLTRYQRDSDDNPVVGEDGAYVTSGVTTNLAPTRSDFPLRLIVHNPTNGPATLLQRVFFGRDTGDNAIVAHLEAALDPGRLAAARRISAAHLPWTAENRGWTFDRAMAANVTLRTSVTNRFNDHASNPFLHTYHPDHDNLDARFELELPQGSESYTVVRDLSLETSPLAGDFNSRVNATSTFAGEYRETLRFVGLERAGNTFDTRSFQVRGTFKLNRISEIPRLTQSP